jgi:uncharacterized OsmC-like protein
MKRQKINKEDDDQVVAELLGTDGFSTRMKAGNHYLVADEPTEAGGTDTGPSPYDFLSAGLASCTAMTLQLYARRKGWPLHTVRVHTRYGKKHALDCEHCEEADARIATFERVLELLGPLSEAQRERLLDIANKCPVHRTLSAKIQILTKLAEPDAE